MRLWPAEWGKGQDLAGGLMERGTGLHPTSSSAPLHQPSIEFSTFPTVSPDVNLGSFQGLKETWRVLSIPMACPSCRALCTRAVTGKELSWTFLSPPKVTNPPVRGRCWGLKAGEPHRGHPQGPTSSPAWAAPAAAPLSHTNIGL